eukprot:EG_transcript_31569
MEAANAMVIQTADAAVAGRVAAWAAKPPEVLVVVEDSASSLEDVTQTVANTVTLPRPVASAMLPLLLAALEGGDALWVPLENAALQDKLRLAAEEAGRRAKEAEERRRQTKIRQEQR